MGLHLGERQKERAESRRGPDGVRPERRSAAIAAAPMRAGDRSEQPPPAPFSARAARCRRCTLVSPSAHLDHWSPPCSLWVQKEKRAMLAPSDPSDGKVQARRWLNSRDSRQDLWFCRWSAVVNIPHIHWPCQPLDVRFLFSLCLVPDVHTRQRTVLRAVGTTSTAAEARATAKSGGK